MGDEFVVSAIEENISLPYLVSTDWRYGYIVAMHDGRTHARTGGLETDGDSST
jgi:hypothetical protein